MEKDHKAVDTAKKGDAVAMKIEVGWASGFQEPFLQLAVLGRMAGWPWKWRYRECGFWSDGWVNQQQHALGGVVTLFWGGMA